MDKKGDGKAVWELIGWIIAILFLVLIIINWSTVILPFLKSVWGKVTAPLTKFFNPSSGQAPRI